MLAAVDHLPRNDSILKNPSLVIDVLQEEIQRGNPLCQSKLHGCPFGCSDDAWNQVIRKNLLRTLLASIDREGDALVQEAEIGCLLPPLQLLNGQGSEVLKQRLAVTMQIAWTRKHLVVGMVQQIVFQCRMLELGGLGWQHWET